MTVVCIEVTGGAGILTWATTCAGTAKGWQGSKQSTRKRPGGIAPSAGYAESWGWPDARRQSTHSSPAPVASMAPRPRLRLLRHAGGDPPLRRVHRQAPENLDRAGLRDSTLPAPPPPRSVDRQKHRPVRHRVLRLTPGHRPAGHGEADICRPGGALPAHEGRAAVFGGGAGRD